MKKVIFCLIAFIIIVSCFFVFDRDDNKKITVAEVTHSVFYAPMYVADGLGYFKEKGFDIDIKLTSGADKVTAAVLSGDVNIGFCGSEATIYLYNQEVEDYLVTFAGLTKRDGSFLVSRDKYDDFSLNDVKGKTIIGGRKGGMPEMTLEYTLKENGLNLENDVFVDSSIDFSATTGAFIGGKGDFITAFEPTALELEKEGYGYVVASIGELGGTVPYTAYNAKKSYIEDNPDVIKGFTEAIQMGLDYVHSHSSEDIAKVITSYFPDTSMNDLIKIVDRYKKIDSWYSTTYISENDFNHIMEIMDSASVLEEKAPYDKLVNNDYAKEEK